MLTRLVRPSYLHFHPAKKTIPPHKANTMQMLPFAATAILRLSLLPGPTALGLFSLLDKAVECLKRMEKTTTVTIPSSSPSSVILGTAPQEHLFRANEIHDELYAECEPLQTWGRCVEALWRATMTMTMVDKPPVWDVLCSRLLLWRAVAGLECSPLGEWARMQVICNMSK